MHILPKGWIHPFRLHICHFCSSFSQFWNSLPKILFWKISLIILCVFVFLWNLRQTLESCNKTKRQQWIMCFVENIYLYFQGRVLGYGEAVLLTASLLFSFCPDPRLILWFPSRFSSTVFLATLVALHFTLVSKSVSGRSFGLQPSSVAWSLRACLYLANISPDKIYPELWKF